MTLLYYLICKNCTNIFYCLDGPSDFCRSSKDLTEMWRRRGGFTFLYDFKICTKQVGGHCEDNIKKGFFPRPSSYGTSMNISVNPITAGRTVILTTLIKPALK
jgi:hypothetical protein